MVAGWTYARDVIEHRLRAVFAPEAFEALYPGAKPPKVSLGFPVTEPPFYAAVDEIVDTAETSGAASMGHAEIDYTIRIWLCAQHADLRTASDTLLAYIDAVFGAIMADPQLCGAADNAFTAVENAGTAADSSKRYIAAASVAVQCQRWSACPAPLAAIVAGDNAEIKEERDEGNSD